MAKKIKEVAKVEAVEAVKVESAPFEKLDDKLIVVIIGEEKGSLKTGGEYTVSGNLANELIKKGYAKLKI